ncbi:MAG: hypothetical protein MUF18_21465 [Fimbriiglobus sp.]|nr:hypothetical protein [Fimbriiglobus sp.]
MIRTKCPKCGREDAVADYLTALPILCNGCGTRVTVGERIDSAPLFPPPPPRASAPPPPPPKPQPAPPPPPKAGGTGEHCRLLPIVRDRRVRPAH